MANHDARLSKYRIRRSVLYRRPVQWILDFFATINPECYSVSHTMEESWKKMESIQSSYRSAVCLWHHKYVPICTVTGSSLDRERGEFKVLLKSGTPVITFKIRQEKNQ